MGFLHMIQRIQHLIIHTVVGQATVRHVDSPNKDELIHRNIMTFNYHMLESKYITGLFDKALNFQEFCW